MQSLNISDEIIKYETAINSENIPSNYWWLGIYYLLAGDIFEAQATWFIPLDNAVDELEWARLQQELSEILLLAAKEQAKLQRYQEALWIRKQYQEISNENLENILELIILSDACEELQAELITAWNLEDNLTSAKVQAIDQELLCAAFKTMLPIINTDNIKSVLTCLRFSDSPKNLINILIHYFVRESDKIEANLCIYAYEYCLDIEPNYLPIMHLLIDCYSVAQSFKQAITMAERYFINCESDTDKILGYYLLMGHVLAAGDFVYASKIVKDYKILLDEIIQNPPLNIEIDSWQAVASSPVYFPYLNDEPEINHKYLNWVGKLYKKFLEQESSSSQSPNHGLRSPRLEKGLRIGYIASTLREHSVGWLSRWLWQHHDRNNYQIYSYFVHGRERDPFTKKWFTDNSDFSYYLPPNARAIADQIRQDQIDILIDLDSITESTTYRVMSYRPAPVQVTWLGWDTSGCPEIDYFIADPYVLPDNAQEYYREKIWRLPESYVAVDGFEIGIASIKRSDFGISPNDVVYYSGQRGYKINTENITAQMEIVKQVPHSHLLIKSRGDQDTFDRLYFGLAQQVGLDFSRVHFLGKDPDELTHRANLQIADVVLDTFPYNGATTTLETLWLGIPMVTKVGEQFAARNSYGFMMNAGIQEGIGYTAEEYIQWGIQLGMSSDLRNQIRLKLFDSRKTSPLWNAASFTQQMEKAYTEMWEIYQQSLLR